MRNNNDKRSGIHQAFWVAAGSMMLMSVALAVTSVSPEITTTVDNMVVEFSDVQPMMLNNRVMVPVRGVFDHMNASVNWDEDSQTVRAQRGSDSIMLPLNSKIASVNGQSVYMDVPAMLQGGRAMVPLRFLSESMKAQVNWDDESQTVQILTGKSLPEPMETVGFRRVTVASGTVIPFRLVDRLGSKLSRTGDKFTASIDNNASNNYAGIDASAVIEGRVSMAQPMSGDTPGVLGLEFKRLRMPNGQAFAVSGSLIGLDSKSVEMENG